ncbi:8-amino-7-oxononanoate synthase-like [Camellia sinensis]|uniref:8-amino-7-oxononanoate synthase-like n=1 Tax=Camellia sinensis TaxID=4442 RepID=UPI001035D58F|nr:8-amino-7-oxononanoate synthase-like [Camellia sinensis]
MSISASLFLSLSLLALLVSSIYIELNLFTTLAFLWCQQMKMGLWAQWVEEALSKLESLKLLRSLRPIHLPINEQLKPIDTQMKNASNYNEFEVFDSLRQWDKASIEVVIADSTFQRRVREIPSCGDDADCGNQGAENGACPQKFRKVLLFSGNDYLGLSSHLQFQKLLQRWV